jgi:endoglucanase
LDPMVLNEKGFQALDRAIQICADHELYTILDLHAAAGCQNQDWHSDNPTHQALFWQHKHFQDRTVWLWQQVAARYKDHAWVAGYNPLNEPADPSGSMLGPFYRRVVSAIREIDPDHIIFLEGNRYAQDVAVLGQPIPNCVYALHNYATPGFIDGGSYPGVSRGEYFDSSVLHQKLIDSCQYMLKNKTPIWIGEFGPVYTGIPENDAGRYEILKEQLSFYRELGANWSLWTYKDLGLHGMVGLQPDSKWMKKIQPILDKKNILGVDSWGGVDRNIRHIMEPIENTFAEFYPGYNPFPFGAQWQINRIVRHILLAEPLIEEFLPLLQGLDYDEIDDLMSSFKFQNCTPRINLVNIIKNECGADRDTL